MKKTLCILLSVLLLAALLCGCGGSGKSSYASSGASSSYYSKSGGETEAAMDTGWAMTEPMAPEAQKSEGMAQQTSASLPANVKLIYRANIDMESTEFDKALEDLNALVARLGGYFENSELNNYSSYRRGSFTVRVPAENFETFCATVGELCKVNSLSRSAEDVSEQYYDIESRLATQKTKLARLQELLKQAEEMEDIITLESAISETELAIEQLTGSLRKYDSLVGYATIYIGLSEVYKLTQTEEPAIGFGAKLAAAFRSGSARFASGLQSFLLDVARGWIGWLIFLIIVAVVVIVVLRIRRKRKARQAAFAQTAAAQPPYAPQTPPQNPQDPQNPQT